MAAGFLAVQLKGWFDRLWPGPGPGHAGRGLPVEANFAGFKEARNAWDYPEAPVTFAFKNREFGEQFIRENRPVAEPGSR